MKSNQQQAFIYNKATVLLLKPPYPPRADYNGGDKYNNEIYDCYVDNDDDDYRNSMSQIYSRDYQVSNSESSVDENEIWLSADLSGIFHQYILNGSCWNYVQSSCKLLEPTTDDDCSSITAYLQCHRHMTCPFQIVVLPSHCLSECSAI